MVIPWWAHGVSVVCPGCVHSVSVVGPWCSRRQSVTLVAEHIRYVTCSARSRDYPVVHGESVMLLWGSIKKIVVGQWFILVVLSL